MRQRSVHLCADAYLVLTELGCGRHIAQKLPEIDIGEGEAERARFDARRVEDVADEVGEPRGLVADQCEERFPLLGGELAPTSLQGARGADHRRHRTAELVRDERDEVGA